MKLKNFKLACLLVFISGCTDSKVKESSVLQASSISTLKEYKNKALQVYTTAKDTELRLTKTSDQIFKDKVQPLETEVAIFINPNKTFQKYLGIGGAITDASSEVFATLDNDQQNKLLQSLFGKEGIGYNIIRTSIHSSDFGLGSHTYIEEGDTDLKTFTIEKDKKKRIPFIKRAIELIKEDLVFYASPWSPPAFMKSNKNMLYGGKLLPEFRQSWADYYVKFIKAYEKEGIPVWGLTIQNEPMAIQRWESCIYTADEERDFLKNYLGPTLENAGLGDKKIIVWDHNRDLISDRANTIFEDSEASKYAWGIGLHWYETWTGGLPKYDNLKNINESFPSKNMLFTEGCAEGFDSEKLHFWPNAERYGNSIINDFNSGVVGWTDWNILLDERGGPNHVENFCFAPIHANTKTGELIFTPTYYYIGHFSKFIKPGAVRVSTTTSRTTIESTSFKNKDGKIITVVMNKTDSKVTYKLIVGNSESLLEIEPRAMQTIIY
jgi:glucosylceramidase|tara:strand:+ start:9595 stop:11076 length:1482 start_codon:yes stop_codon:yes gene_type:complete